MAKQHKWILGCLSISFILYSIAGYWAAYSSVNHPGTPCSYQTVLAAQATFVLIVAFCIWVND